jgi:hypothetical protein
MESVHTQIRTVVQSRELIARRLSERGSQLAMQRPDLVAIQERLKDMTSCEMRGKMENDALLRRKVELDRQFLDHQAEFSEIMQELNREKALTMERKSQLTGKMADFQQCTRSDDVEIRGLMSEIDELTAKIEMTKKQQIAARKECPSNEEGRI